MPQALQHGLVLAAGTLLVLLTAPLLLELLLVTLAATLPPRHPQHPATLSPIQRLIVLVPSHNEEGSIRACVQSLATSGATDILVVAHNCTDRTAEYAAGAGAHVSRLDDPQLPGKGNALTHGFDLAFQRFAADAVLVIDADSTVSPNLIPAVQQALSRHRVVQTRYQSHAPHGTARGHLQALSFLCKNVVRATGRQRLGLSCGIFGNGFAFRREVLDRVPYAAHSIVEDLEFHLSLLTHGIPTAFVPQATVLAVVPASAAGQRTQAARWEGGRIQMMRTLAPRIAFLVLRGNLRLAEPLLDLLGQPIALQVLLLVLLLLLPANLLTAYALLGLVTLAFHLLVGLQMSPNPRQTGLALLQAPWYVVKKVALTRSILAMTRNRASWVKTSRAPAEK